MVGTFSIVLHSTVFNALEKHSVLQASVHSYISAHGVTLYHLLYKHRDIHGIFFLHYLYAQIFDLFRPQWILLMFLREVWSTRLRKKVMSVWNYTKWDAQSGRETRHFLCFTIIRVFSVNFNQLFHERYEHFSRDKIKSTMLRDHSRSSLLGIRTPFDGF